MKWWQKKPYIDVIKAYDKSSVREKNIVLYTLITALLLIGYVLLIEPLAISSSELLEKENKINETNNTLAKKIEETKNKEYNDPNAELRNELDRLMQKSLRHQDKINLLTQALVAPRQMVSLLESVLTEDKKLKLISLRNLPEVALSITGQSLSEINPSAENDEGVIPEALIYKHAFEIELEATYDSALAYLKRLDDLQWQLFWQDLRYETTTYPKGILKIRIYTLSMSKEVLGV